MNMLKLFIYTFIAVAFCGTIFGQGVGDPILKKPDGSMLLAKVSAKDEDPSERIIHTIENTLDKLEKDPTAVYAIRICSPNSLPIAFADASGIKLAVRQITQRLDYLKNTKFINFPESNIFLLRNNKKCQLSKNPPVTEYWYVPSNAELPEFVEIRKYGDITFDELTFDYEKFDTRLLGSSASEAATLNAKDYEAVKAALVQKLKKDKTSLLLIEVPQFIIKRKTKIAAPQADELKSFLIRNEIGSHRIFIKRNGYFYQKTNSDTDLYPNLTIIRQT